MKKLISAAIAAFALTACSSMHAMDADEHAGHMAASEPAAEATMVTAMSAHIAAAVAGESRPQADRDRDAARKPAEMLAFAEVQPGETIAEMIPAGGYFTRLFAGAVGDDGRVFAIIPPNSAQFNWSELIAPVAAAHANVTVLTQAPTQLATPEPVDLVFTAQNYHDLHIARYGMDAASVNQAVFNALKPGGVYLVIDHSAVDGSDMTVPEALHRIDQAAVRREIEAAGFVFEGESDALRNPADPRTAIVFDPAIRGQTDQFVLRFRKPG